MALPSIIADVRSIRHLQENSVREMNDGSKYPKFESQHLCDSCHPSDCRRVRDQQMFETCAGATKAH
jgi:hypothetical protein